MSEVERGAIAGASLAELDQLAYVSAPDFFENELQGEGADQKRDALRELVSAFGMDDLAVAIRAEERLGSLGLTDKQRADVSHYVVDRCSSCSAEIALWFSQTAWLDARHEAMKSGRGYHAENDGRSYWLGRLAGDGNRAAFDALISAEKVSLDEALLLSCHYSNPAMGLRYASRIMAQNRAPTPEALTAFCNRAHTFEATLSARAGSHPLSPFLTVWADSVGQQDRSRLWVSAISQNSPALVGALARAGLSLKDWRLTPEYGYSGEGKDPFVGPRLFDYALTLARHHPGLIENKAFEALWLIEPLVAHIDDVYPKAFKELSNTEMEHLVRRGVNILGVDELGNNYLHDALKNPPYIPSSSYLLASAKRFPIAWGRSNNQGKSPLEMITDKKLADAVAMALSQGEDKELRKELKGRRGSKVVKSSRSL